MPLREYQITDVQNIRQAIAEGKRRVCYQGATGSGKTRVFSHIAMGAIAKGTSTCIIVHRAELLQQASDSLRECDVPHGIIAAGHKPTPGLVQVAMAQTLVRRDVQDFKLIICDESHHYSSDTGIKIFQRHPQAVVLGVTATPCRLSGRGLSDVFDVLVQGPPYSKLIRDNYLVPAQVWASASAISNLKGIKTLGGDFKRDELEAFMDQSKITGNAIATYRKVMNGLPSIVFCCSIAHAEHTAEQFRAEGYRSVTVDGSLDMEERKRRFDDFYNGRLNALVSVQLVLEGYDCPSAMGAVWLRPTKSLCLWMQGCGRILRPYPGKTHAVILDHVGNSFRHGLPDQDREWTLEAGAVKRKKDPDEINIRQCPNCYYVHEYADTCPTCGYEYPRKAKPQPVEEEGELVQFTREEAAVAIQAARTLADFRKICKRMVTRDGKPYRPGWAYGAWIRKIKGGQLERRKL
jgi:superfamily II DNA or RNA helicase